MIFVQLIGLVDYKFLLLSKLSHIDRGLSVHAVGQNHRR